ncbi:MAG: hypothetical protein KJ941_12000, partial [Bacteroidetes bacterium]|nr:hypothetical protein [Bacteroidota bacterium]
FGVDFGAQYTLKEKWKFGAVLRDATSTFNGWMFTLDDQTKQVFTQTGNEIPANGLELTLPRLIIGGYRKFDLGKKGINMASEINVDITTDRRRNTVVSSDIVSMDPHMGLAVGFKEFFQVRAGVNNLQYVKQFDDSQKLNFQPTLGVGIHVKNFSLDYAFTDIGDVSVALYSHVISIRLQLNEPNNITSKKKE